MKKNPLWALIMVLLGALLLELGYAGFFCIRVIDRAEPSTLCRQNLHDLYLGFEAYLKDHQGRFPASWKNDEFAWVGGLKPYYQPVLNEPFRCPENPDLHRFYTYRFNPELAGKEFGNIAMPEKIPLLTETGKPHCDQTGYFCLFLDGRVKEFCK